MKNFLSDIAKAGRELVGLPASRGPAGEFAGRCHELLKLRGEAAAIALADELLQRYAALDAAGRMAFFRMLLEDMIPEGERIEQAIERYREAPGPQTLMHLASAVESPRLDLLRALNMAPGGTAALVRMREDLLTALREAPELTPVDRNFEYVFSSWFNRGFLSLQKIDWETPAFILEKLIAYEAVHEIRGWEDLRRRLAADRRCFAFFHPALPDEPLIFVQVALVRGLSDNIEALLASEAGDDGDDADTAIFYSISNCQRGLKGVSFGNFLIKQVTEMLAGELPGLKHYATLSPVPTFTRWLQQARETPDNGALPLKPAEAQTLELLADPHWHADAASAKKLRPVLRKLLAHYLLNEKQGREPRDPVARFHLRNGARLERINWLADLSDKGLADSCAMMVNYLYEPRSVLRNHEAFVNRGDIAAASAVRNLAG